MNDAGGCRGSCGPVVVLDLNGILADVRRKEAPRVDGRDPDVVLPNGQKAYMNPGWRRFVRFVLSIPRVRVVLYTSRLRKNSEPVERLMQPEILMVSAILHGEQCLPPSGFERFHPIKSAAAVVREVGCLPSDLIFMDDNPHRIDLGADGGRDIRVIKIRTYDARAERTLPDNLDDAIAQLRELVACDASKKKHVLW